MPEMGIFIAFATNSVAPVIAVNKGPGDAGVRNCFLPGESKVKSDGVRFYQKSCPAMLRLPVDRVRHSLGIPTSSFDEEPVFQLTSVNKIVHNTRLSVLSFQTAKKNTDYRKILVDATNYGLDLMFEGLCYGLFIWLIWFSFQIIWFLSKSINLFANHLIWRKNNSNQM